MKYIYLLFFAFVFIACNLQQNNKNRDSMSEDKSARKMLQGVWLNEDEGSVAFRVKKDTIYYPDSTSLPVKFKIIADTLVLYGHNIVKYPIVNQTTRTFSFKNQSGDLVKFVLSEDPFDLSVFNIVNPKGLNINQKKTIKRDTIISFNKEKFHCYVQINPTTYKVVKTIYNEDGVEVDNIYYDNIIHISIYRGAEKVISKDFRKKDFKSCVPNQYLSQAILSDILFKAIDLHGIHFFALLGVPDSPTNYIVKLFFSYDGKIRCSNLELN